MKIVAIADSHGQHESLSVPDGDVFIHAGDNGVWSDREAFKFNKWLGTLPHKHKIIIAGNHDRWFEIVGKRQIKKVFTNAIYLENEEVTIDDIKFWGSPITPRFMDWFFMRERGSEIAKYWELIPEDTDVVITHGPCYKILDNAPRGAWFESVGCEELRKKILEIKPLCHFFGHIHFDYGKEIVNDIGFYNVSVLNEMYQLINKPTEVYMIKGDRLS